MAKDSFGHGTVKDKMQEAKDLAAPYIKNGMKLVQKTALNGLV